MDSHYTKKLHEIMFLNLHSNDALAHKFSYLFQTSLQKNFFFFSFLIFFFSYSFGYYYYYYYESHFLSFSDNSCQLLTQKKRRIKSQVKSLAVWKECRMQQYFVRNNQKVFYLTSQCELMNYNNNNNTMPFARQAYFGLGLGLCPSKY